MTGSMFEEYSRLQTVTPIARESLPEKIVEQILELIAAGAFEGNLLPPERGLSEELRVSRASLREAMSLLIHTGVVVTNGNRKLVVPDEARTMLVVRSMIADVSQREVRDPFEVRRIIEPTVAALAAERASQEAIDEIKRWLVLSEGALVRDEETLYYGLAFHLAIAKASTNHLWVGIIASLSERIKDARGLSSRLSEWRRMSLVDHNLIFNAIEGRRVDEAHRTMRAHIDHVEAVVRSDFHDADAPRKDSA
jgi:GntR family transcriptional repressor for pyruvate dehydrogenase complex